jgi:hypothetical protein
MPLPQSLAIEQVRARLAEETPGFYADSQIRTWLNDGVREVARRALWKRMDQQVIVTSGTQFYTAPATAIQIYRVEYAPTGTSMIYPLEYRDINAMDIVWGLNQSTGQGTPSYYTLVSANPVSIELCPTPSRAGNLKVYYYAMTTDLATTNSSDANTPLDVPIGWEDLPVSWATGMGFRKSRDVQAYQLEVGAFSEQLNRLTEMATRYTDEPTHIQPGADWAWAMDYGF